MSKNKNLSGGLFHAKPTPLAQKESSLSNQIAEYLSKRGIWNERLNAGKVQTPNGHWLQLCGKGTPDRITIVRGQAIFIETKTLGKQPTAEQSKAHDDLRQAGAIVFVADSFNEFIIKFSAIRAALETNGRKENLYD